MNLAQFPRRRYTVGYTPLEYLANLTKLMDGPEIYIKRDDLLGLAAGGNKTRKLEFLVADALNKHADCLITCGAVQSNHCRLTLAAAKKEGLDCYLVLEERVPGSYSKEASGNNFLFRLMGLDDDHITVVAAGTSMVEAMEKVAAGLKAKRHTPYVIVGGGSNPIGATGYVACAEEILAQCFEQNIDLDYVITTSGSAGTHAGLAVGFFGTNSQIPVIGINNSRPNSLQVPIVTKLAIETAKHVGIREDFPADSITCFDGYVGPGYSRPTEEMIKAVELLAQTEAILLDPVYTGKAFAGMLDLIRKGYFKKGEKICFLHTGGAPALYYYKDEFHLV
ncbi:MAG TPA: D-cysteine desulfhydrase [Bacillota bacterium]|nr:D-cysteine desulfhydrase [Bacillota bacterium]